MSEPKSINEILPIVKYSLIGNVLILAIVVLLRFIVNKDVFITRNTTSILFTILPLVSIVCFIILVAYLLNTCFRNKSITRKKALIAVISSYICIIFTFATIYSFISFFSDASSSYGDYSYYSKEFSRISNKKSELEKKKIISNLDFPDTQYAFSGIKNKFFYSSNHPNKNLSDLYEQYRIRDLSDTTLSGKQKLLWYYYNSYKDKPSSKDFFLSTTLSEYASAYTEYLYFSIITIATVGYGDIVPTSNPVRFLVSMEIFIGQIVMVIAIALIISKHYAVDNDDKQISISELMFKFKTFKGFLFSNKKEIQLSYNPLTIIRVIFIIILIIATPPIIDFLFFNNSLFHYLKHNDWASFLGGYLGGVLGGLITLYVLFKTLNHNKNLSDENKKLSILPYLNFSMEDSFVKESAINNDYGFSIYLHFGDSKDSSDFYSLLFTMTNVGLGNTIDWNFDTKKARLDEYNITSSNESAGINNKQTTINVLEKNKTIKVLINVNNCIIKDKRNLNLSLPITFKDFIGTEYLQIMKLSLVTEKPKIACIESISHPKEI